MVDHKGVVLLFICHMLTSFYERRSHGDRTGSNKYTYNVPDSK